MTQGNDNRIKARDISGGNFAPGGTANYHAAPAAPEAAELQARLDELNRLLTQHAAALPDVQQLQDLARELGTQLQGHEPNRTVVGSLLASLTAGAGGVNAVLAAADGLTRFVSRLLG